jgi:dTMP kinase
VNRGTFITFEGIDGAGKSTHLDWLARLCAERGIRARVTREPGGTPCGERLRELLLAPDQHLHPETEALLMFAARREHLDKVINPALAAGEWVICDRFTDASFAYQGGGSGVDWLKLEALERWVQGSLQPDLTVILDVPPQVGRSRALRSGGTPDRFESEREEFYVRVREAYLRRAAAALSRIKVIDAGGSIEDTRGALSRVAEALWP